MKKIFYKLLSLLRVRMNAAGLEVSDQVLRLVNFNRKSWQMHAVRLEPGIVESGRIKNREAFIAALVALRAEVLGKEKATKKMSVVLCMSSAQTYTQLFSLPLVQNKDLEKAVELNLQMASPLEAGEAHAGWQIVEREKDKPQLQILSAFMDRKMVDEMVSALFDAGFLVMAVESRALALTRMLREKGAGIDAAKSYLFISIDDAGIDFLIIRNGALYFEYTNAWRDLMDEKGEIAASKFEATLAAGVRQVVNFYNQHWAEPLGAIILSTAAFEAEAEKAIASNAPVPTVSLTLVMGQPISSEWLTALGCSLRESGRKAEDREISFLGEDSEDRFREEQLLHFMRFWRAVVPVTLALLVIVFIAADAFLMNTKSEIESRSDFNIGGGEGSSVAALQASAKNFNQLVALVAAAENAGSPKNVFLGEIVDLATEDHVTITHLSFQSFGAPISLSGTAQAEDDALAFKTALENDSSFGAIDLPLTGIQTNGNILSFSMTFTYTPPQ